MKHPRSDEQSHEAGTSGEQPVDRQQSHHSNTPSPTPSPKARSPLIDWTRRDFVKTIAIGVGGATLMPGCGSGPRGKWRFFTDTEATLVEAIAEQIIPADDDPGARDVGVLNYIDKQLAGFFSDMQTRYRAGLVGVEETSQAMHGASFVTLDQDKQAEVLEALESGKASGATWSQHSPRDFFRMVRNHTMQGFYGSPRHGGNKGYVSYKMVGLDYPPVMGRSRSRES